MRMANIHLDILPCKINLPLATVIAHQQGQSENDSLGEALDSAQWSDLIRSAGAGSDYDFSTNDSLFGLNISSTVSFTKPVTLAPTDTLLTNPFYLTLTIGSLLGNLAMMSVILFTPQFRKPANYLIVNLSLSSIYFILSTNLRLLENVWDIWGGYDTFRCRLLAVIHRIPVPCVALTTMIISLDRGRVARNPLNGSSIIQPVWKIIFIWSFSLLIVTPLAFTRVNDDCVPTAYKCAKVVMFGHSSLSMMYGIAYLMSVHVVPAVILIRESVKTQKIMKFLKLSSVDHIHQNQQHLQQFAINPSYPSCLSDNRLRLLRNANLFTMIFLVFWLPYGIFQFPLDLPKAILPELLDIYVRFYFRFVRNIAYLQIALNPVILFALSYDLRMYLARVKCDLRQTFQNGHNNHNGRCNGQIRLACENNYNLNNHTHP